MLASNQGKQIVPLIYSSPTLSCSQLEEWKTIRQKHVHEGPKPMKLISKLLFKMQSNKDANCC